MTRILGLCLLLLVAALPVRAQDLPDYAAAADRYLNDIQARFSDEPDFLASRASRLDGDAAAGRGAWAEAVRHYERAVALGADDFDTWIGLSRALGVQGTTEDAIAAAYSARLAAGRASERAQSLFLIGEYLDKANRAREAMRAYQAGLYIDYDQRIADRLQVLSDASAFRLINASTGLDGEEARICLQFRSPLKDAKSVHYEDYVKLQPEATAAFSVSYDTLCLDGLDYGASYRVTILKGLPSVYDEQLEAIDEVTVEIGDRTPSVGFPGSTYVLPKVGSTGIPLVSVNVDQARLQLFRVTDRNLVQQIYQGRLLRSLDGYERSQLADELGEEIWKGEVDIVSERNKRVTTSIPIGEVLPQTAPGVYVLTAETPGNEANSWDYRATQWFVVTDLGLTTMTGADGLHVFVRSLSTGDPVEGIDLRLFARNNEELGRTVSDATGVGSFAPGLVRGGAGRTATAVMAAGADGDFVFIDLTKAAFDLSDRGVGGRAAPGPTDAFLYTDRGVYRPGEIVQLVTLLRGSAGNALNNLPISIKLYRPDGVAALERTLTEGKNGGFHLPVPISVGARTGSWTALAYLDPAGPPVGSVSFLVEEVVPARIEVKLRSSTPSLEPGTPLTVSVDARHLYGAPAADLPVKAALVITRNDRPFDAFPGFAFTLSDETVDALQVPLDDARTDADGRVQLDIALDQLPDTPQPLKAKLTVEVYEFGGRPVIETLELPIRNRSLLIGIKPLFADGQVADGAEAAFEVVAANADGIPAGVPGLRYALIREDWDYQWFFRSGMWDYEVIVRDRSLQSGELDVAAANPGRIAERVGWGQYRLEVFDPASGAASSVRFSAGWSVAPGTAATPDKLQIVADAELYQPGRVASALIKPPFAGPVLLTIATDRILETRIVQATTEGVSVEVPIDAAWGAGAYLLATAFRPGSDQETHGPGRAVGVTWLGIDPAQRSLEIAMELPPDSLPRQRIEVPVKVTGARSEAFLTLAAVDEGILQLTDFVTPDPRKHFFGKRRLGVELRDLYGNLIDGREGRRGTIRSGGDGDALARRGAPPSSIQLVALFSGIIKLDSSGAARIPLDLPDFNGRLRLMAVAYDGSKVGSAEAALVVRDPVVVQLSMPRFLATGDRSELAITVQNVTGAAGIYRFELTAEGAIDLGEGASFTRGLALGASATSRVPLNGLSAGEGKIAMAVSGPGGFRLERTAGLGVRPPQLPIVERTARRLAPGESLTLSDAAIARFVPGSGELLASFSATPNLDVPGLLRTLDRYPYGCLEQTTSRALPLLYVGNVAELWQVKADEGGDVASTALKRRIQEAVTSVIERQRYDGGFGLWSGDSPAEAWLSGYAMDFLIRARQQGYTVPEFVVEQGLRWLDDYSRNYQQDDSDALGARAYAYYVLAIAGTGDLSGLRYLNDTYARRMPTAMATAQLAAALSLYGDQQRAASTFRLALARLDRARRALRDYGSMLRDLAATVTLMIESRADLQDPAPLVERLAGLQLGSSYLSTQEQAWLVMAAKAAAEKKTEDMSLAVDDVIQPPRQGALNLRPSAAELATGIKVTNAGTGPVWTVATVIGAPITDQPPESGGFTITRKFYTTAGEETPAASVRQSDTLVVVITGRTDSTVNHQALVVDLLPAGFEVENSRLADARSAGDFAWLPELTPTLYTEFLDDRFIAAFDLGWDRREFAVAYLVRAVTPGTYRLPASQVEDMYLPQYRARTAMGSISIVPYQQ